MKEAAVGDWELERFRLGELDPHDAVRVSEALERDETLRARLAALDASDAEILGGFPARAMAAAIRARAADAPAGVAPARRKVALAVAASVVIAGAWVLLPRGPQPGAVEPAPDVTRIKGQRPHLVLYRKAPAGPEPLRNGGVVRPGDTVQVEYVAAGFSYGVVVSRDGRGAVTVHLSAGDQAAALAGGRAALAAAFELDDAPAFEEFYFVASHRPFAVEVVIDALLRATASPSKSEATDLGVPPELAVSTFLLRKDSRR